jgi:membrane protease YdiL (CAAX protease family)
VRYRELPDLVVWPFIHAGLAASLLGGIGFAVGPKYGPPAVLLGGIAAWGLMRRYYGARHAALAGIFGWTSDRGAPGFRWTAAICMALLFAPAAAWLAFVGVHPRLPVGMSPSDMWWAVALVATAPVNEEVLFRGVLLFGLLACGCRPVVALSLQAAVFTLAHGFESATPFNVSTRFVGGVIYGLVALQSAGLWQAVALHVGWNLMEQARAFLSGGMVADSPVALAWHTGLPAFVGVAMTMVFLVVMNRRHGVLAHGAGWGLHASCSSAEVGPAPPVEGRSTA